MTMNYLKNISSWMLMCILMVGFTACGSDDEEVSAPSVVLEEANIEGDEICVEADIKAPGRTRSIGITVEDRSSSITKVSKVITDSKYIGVLNIEGFHVHVDIVGKGVNEGDILKLGVTDANGKTTIAQKFITEEEEDGEDEHHHE